MNLRKKSFSSRLVGLSNRLSKEIVDASFLDMFKARWEEASSSQVYLKDIPGHGGEIVVDDLQSPFQTKPFYDSVTP